MKVFITCTAHDLITGKKRIIAKGDALLNGNRLLYPDSEKGYRNSVSFDDDCIRLERIGEVSSVTSLSKKNNGESHVNSIYGEMIMTNELIAFHRTDEEWGVEYRIISGDEEVLHQILNWEIEIR